MTYKATLTKRERMYQRIYKHGENLCHAFGITAEPVPLCKALRRLENKAHRLAEDYCNGLIDSADYESAKDQIHEKLIQLLGDKVPTIVNGDPRGYALKVPDDYVRDHNLDIHRDFGGYGIIAPDLS